MTAIPKYQEIADKLRKRLADGKFPVGSALPSISALQDEYGVAGLNTVRQGLAILQEEGLIRSEQGRGTFVLALPKLAGDPDLDILRMDADELQEVLDTARSVLSRLRRHLG